MALAAKFAERRTFAAVHCSDRCATDMREHEASNPQLLRLRSDIEHCRVTARPMSETDLAAPSGRVREHQVDASGPGWKLQELRCPGNASAMRCDQVANVGCEVWTTGRGSTRKPDRS